MVDLNVQLSVEYATDKESLKIVSDTLGMTAWYKQAQNKNQEALISLLYMFKTNLSDELKTEIIAKGIPQSLLESITGYANTLKQANITQELAKGNSKEISHEGQDELNAIYQKVIGVAKIASRFFVDNKVKKELFSYSKILSQLTTPSSKGDDGETPAE